MRKQRIAVIISLFCVFFITLFSRRPTLVRTVHLVPLWSFVSSGQWKQILLNILLFIPLGYFWSGVFSNCSHRRLWMLLSALFVSTCIELLQFFTYRGMLDVDDLVSNVCGAVIGQLIYRLLYMTDKRGYAAWIMLTASVIGCFMVTVSATKSSFDVNVTKQLAFSISSLEMDDGKTVIEGQCFLYDRQTPDYTILIDDKEAKTEVDGQKFISETLRIDHKAKIEIHFKSYPIMPTGTWINGDQIEYVAGEIPEIDGLSETAVLKAWNEEHDTLVYQEGDRLLWLIGWHELHPSTEVIYHIHTTEPEKLPEKRIQYGFDNRGFRVGDDKMENELESIEHYRVFEREIPSEYNITAVIVGFNTDGTITWTDSFRPGA